MAVSMYKIRSNPVVTSKFKHKKAIKIKTRFKRKKPPETQHLSRFLAISDGPSDRSRTCGLLNPIQARYQSALHPDMQLYSNRRILSPAVVPRMRL